MKTLISASIIALSASVLALGACTNRDAPYLMEDTHLHAAPIVLEQGRQIIKKPLEALSDADLQDVAAMYKNAGEGRVYVVSGQPAKAPKGATPKALREIVKKLISFGVPASALTASEVPQNEGTPVVLIAFDTIHAKVADDCRNIPGFDRPVIGQADSYEYALGCTINDLFAQQVAHKRDLQGVAGLGGENDANRAADVVDANIRSGTKARDAVPGYSLGSVGSN